PPPYRSSRWGGSPRYPRAGPGGPQAGRPRSWCSWRWILLLGAAAPERGGRCANGSVAASGGLRAAVDVDLLLADLVADLLLVGHRLLVEADALDRHGLLGDDRPLL